MYRIIGKLFIKDYKNLKDEKIRNKYGKVAGIIGIITNLLLGVLKVVLGLITLSVSIISDAINNITDSLSSIITLVGFKLSEKGADEDHPFGHQRIEFISGLIIAVIMLVVSVLLLKESIEKIITPVEMQMDYIVVILLGASILVKLLQGLFYRSVSKAIDSVSLKANSQDSFNDSLSTLLVLIASIIFVTTGLNIDGYIGIAISVYVIYSSINLIKESSSPLIGTIPPSEEIEEYKKAILSYDGILGVHDVTCHSYGPTKLFMVAHAEVSETVPIGISHEIIDKIELDFRQNKNIDLTIHMDPINDHNQDVLDLRNLIRSKIKEIDERMDIHDFRVVKGENRTNILFDCEIPVNFKYTKTETKEILTKLVKDIDNKYFLVLQIDQMYDRK